VAIAIAFISKSTDYTSLGKIVPEISAALINTLLTILSTSMLGVATFSVASMVSAYASASSTATPRTFSLVIADDVSQNALSVFIGAFIFSVISLIALGNSYYEKAGRFTLFTVTLFVFALVIFTFVRWVDRIARLGRLGTIIDKAETATAKAIKRRRSAPNLGGVAVTSHPYIKQSVCGELVGYVQRIDIASLQAAAEASKIYIEVVALPGTFVAPGHVLAYLTTDADSFPTIDTKHISQAFIINGERIFDEDPRFGLTVLSEIASRALSPAVNDPGTAIDVIGTLVRLFVLWSEPVDKEKNQTSKYERVAVPEISLQDMFDDAFSAIARDGADKVEVVVCLLRAFESLTMIEDNLMRETALQYASIALARAERTLQFLPDLAAAQKSARFINTP
jgi:uncharacterized membrane protein